MCILKYDIRWVMTMIQCQVPRDWLFEALGSNRRHDIPPQMAVDDESMKITIFPKGGAAMRVMSRPTELIAAGTSIPALTFKVTDAMRTFLFRLKHFRHIRLCLDSEKSTVQMTMTTTNAALRYSFHKVEFVEDNLIPPDLEDVTLEIPTLDWLALWQTIGAKGSVSFAVVPKRRAIVMKHSSQRWGAALHAQEPAKQKLDFTCDTAAAKATLAYCNPENDWPVLTKLTFMKCGVLRWNLTDDYYVYMAPSA